MSADNWTICPQCLVRDPFLNQRDCNTHTFREDYEIGMNTDGSFVVIYSGRCTECDLRHEFKHTAQPYRRPK